MNKGLLLAGVGVVVVGGAVWVMNSQSASAPSNTAAAVGTSAQTQQQPAPAPQPAAAAAANAFASSPDYAYATEVYPTPASDATSMLGAFTIKKSDLGGGQTKVTLVNGGEAAEGSGYQDQSVTVNAGQSVYFIEKTPRDDTTSEDSNTKDDYLVVVDAQGNLVQQ